MVYSYDTHPNAPYEFPPPPPFLVWVQSKVWDSKSRTYKTIPEGQVRHMADLSKAKERVRKYTKPHRYYNPLDDKDAFHSNWALYLWNADKGEYDLQYEGKAGEKLANNPLFRERITKAKKHQPRPGLEDEVVKALASIASAL